MASDQNFGQYYTKSDKPTDVNVVGFSDTALKGIINSINSLKSSVERFSEDYDEGQAEAERRARREAASTRTERTNQERRQRAANAALFGKIDKQLSTLEVLKTTIKDAFDSVIDVIKEGFSKSLRSYDEMAKELRRQNLSNEVKKYAQTLADRANVGTYKVTRESAVAVTNFLAQSDTALLKKFTDANATDAQKKLYGEIVNLGAVFKEGGMDESTIAKLLGQINESNLETWRKVALQSRASGSEGAVARQVLTQMMNTPGGIASLGKDIAGGLNSVMQSARTAMSVGGISENLATKFIEVSNKIQSGDIYDIDQDALARALAVAGNKLNNPQALIESFNKQLLDIQRATGTDRDRLYNDLIGKLTPLSTTMPDLVSEMRISAGRALAGNLNEESAEKLEQIKENLEDNRAEGKLNDWIGNITSKINLFTEDTLGVKGGILGGLATDLDELFGQQIGMDQVVRNGFKTTVDLLKSINLKLTLQSIGNVLSKSGMLDKLATKFPFLSKLGFGTTATGATATTTAATAANVGKLAKLGKFAKVGGKALGVAGGAVALGITAKEIYDAANWEAESVASTRSSMKFKEYEAEVNAATKTAKVITAATAGATSLGGMAIGAAIGSAVPIVGTAIGAVVGAGVGTIVTSIADGCEKISRTTIHVENVKDLQDTVNNLEQALNEIAKKEGKDSEHYKQVKQDLDEANAALNEGIKNSAKYVANNFKEINGTNEKYAKNLEAIARMQKLLEQDKSTEANLRARLNNSNITDGEKTEIEKQLASLSKSQVRTRQAIAGLAGLEFKIREGETDEQAIMRISSDVVGNGYGTITAEDVEFDAARTTESLDAFLKQQALDSLTNGVTYEILDSLKQLNADQIAAFVKEANLGAGMSTADAVNQLTKEIIALAHTEEDALKWEQSQKNKVMITQFAKGGIVNKATHSIIGEAGKEAVLPLTRPNAMASVLKSLSNDEKYALIKSLIGSGGNLTKLDFIKALFSAVFGSSSTKQTGSAESLVSDELAQNIIAGAAAQKGHSYTEMVCNQLVEAALRYAGFPLPTTGVVTKHFNHPSMHLVLNDPVNGISPNDPALLPGMILFSHPFTQAEADQLNRTKGGRRKAGDPGHMGIYAGNGLWWNSTSSKRFVDYSSGNGINSTASGVALTKPYTTGTYKLYAAGYYDGMFGTSETRRLPHATPNSSFASDIDSAISSTGLLSDNEIRSIKKSVGNDPAMKQYIDQATKLLTSGNHGDIVAILVEIARYLKGIASAPANKSPLFSASRPNIPVFQ